MWPRKGNQGEIGVFEGSRRGVRVSKEHVESQYQTDESSNDPPCRVVWYM